MRRDETRRDITLRGKAGPDGAGLDRTRQDKTRQGATRMSEQILLFNTLDELRAWSADKNAMPGGWFDERKVYLVIDEGPIMVAVTEGRDEIHSM